MLSLRSAADRAYLHASLVDGSDVGKFLSRRPHIDEADDPKVRRGIRLVRGSSRNAKPDFARAERRHRGKRRADRGCAGTSGLERQSLQRAFAGVDDDDGGRGLSVAADRRDAAVVRAYPQRVPVTRPKRGLH